VTEDDATTGVAGALAFTGGSALPWVVVGIALLLVGATLSAVSWQRSRRSEPVG
jgi:predicted signal transduction protein with EAL and GGDEF domain